MKVLYFDTETTGKNGTTNGLIQLSGAFEIDGKIKEEFNFNIAPFKDDIIEDEALIVTGLTREQIAKYEDPRKAYTKITTMFGKYIDKFDRKDKFYPAGYNVRFDLDFLASFFKKNFDMYFGSWCNWRAIDGLTLCHILEYRGILKLPDYKLSTVCEYFKIPLKAHDAVEDIRATRTVIKKLLEYIKA